MKDKVEQALEEVRPMLALHAGGIELVGVEEGIVSVRLLGTCHGCPLSELTLKAGVEEILKERVPGVTEVRSVS